ncbi:MAG: hypothetical protein WD468_00285 [Pirellulales bacterium]
MNRRRFLQHSALGAALATGHFSAPRLALAAQVSRSSRRLLFVDDADILYSAGTQRILRPLDRHPSNPVIRAKEKPWEVEIAWNSVYRNPDTGLYQLWYQAYSGKLSKAKTHRCVVCYAESHDGVNWEKPNLGLHSYNGIQDTNIVLIGNGGFSVNYSNSVVFDPQDRNPARRYKMAYWDFSKDQGREMPGLSVAFSPDGIRWTKYPSAPLLKAGYSDVGKPVAFADEPGNEWDIPLSFSDAVDALYDPKLKAFVIYHKMWIDGPDGNANWKHVMGRAESKDFIHWSKPQLVLAPDDLDPPSVEFHHSPVFYYNDRYFSLLQILNRAENNGIIDVELALSRDGLLWNRPFRQDFFLPRNTAGAFDSGNLTTNGSPVILDDEIRYYYGGGSGGAISQDIYKVESGIGLATMPRDRFASLRPRSEIAQFTTKLLELGRDLQFSVNADASRGAVLPELLNVDGHRIRGFSKDDAVQITGDSLSHPVRWKGADSHQLPSGRFMLRLHLVDHANVFAAYLNDSSAG